MFAKWRLNVLILVSTVAIGPSALADDAKKPAEEPDKAALPEPAGFETVWSHPEGYSSITIDAKSQTYAIDVSSRCTVFDATGKKAREFPFAGTGYDRVYAARGAAPNETYLVLNQLNSLLAITTAGKRIWESDPASIRDVCVADLDGDGLDEIIACHLGPAQHRGVFVLDCDGNQLWRQDGFMAQRVSVGNLGGDARLEVICGGADQLRMFAADGSEFETIDGRFKFVADSTPLAVRRPGDKVDTIVSNVSEYFYDFGGNVIEVKHWLVALDTLRNPTWTIDTQESVAYILRGTPCPTEPWVVVSLVHGEQEILGVMDVTTGKIIASIDVDLSKTPTDQPQVAWFPARKSEPPMLLVDKSHTLTAYTVRPKAAK